MIKIIDYNMGNLRSVRKAFEYVGLEAEITDRPEDLKTASHIVLPGVGAFGDAARSLRASGMRDAICEAAEAGKPMLGICLGMQLLFTIGLEYGKHLGLCLVPGMVTPFEVPGLRVPHVGWNSLSVRQENDPVIGRDGEFVYFVHSFHAAEVDPAYVLATSDYGYEFPAAVRKDNIYGLQFHPEKSGEAGLGMIKRFGELKG